MARIQMLNDINLQIESLEELEERGMMTDAIKEQIDNFKEEERILQISIDRETETREDEWIGRFRIIVCLFIFVVFIIVTICSLIL